MDNEYQKMLIRIIDKAKDKVEGNSRIFTGTWHNALFDNDCLRSFVGFMVYGDCVPRGFVHIDINHSTVKAYDANMSMLKIWNIE